MGGRVHYNAAMNIVLMGYRGSGKTSIGRLLASQLWKTFVDVDDETCKRFGSDSIAAIWQEHGEPAWREAEVAVTRELLARDEQVIGLGGGTVMQRGAYDAIRDAADCRRIYLQCDATELHRRIEADTRSAATRPSLTPHAGGFDEVRSMLSERDPVYRELADVTLDVTHLDPAGAARYLIANHL